MLQKKLYGSNKHDVPNQHPAREGKFEGNNPAGTYIWSKGVYKN